MAGMGREDPWEHTLKYVELGQIMLANYTEEQLLSGYGTVDPFWVGMDAVAFGDIDVFGNLT